MASPERVKQITTMSFNVCGRSTAKIRVFLSKEHYHIQLFSRLVYYFGDHAEIINTEIHCTAIGRDLDEHT